ncbi:thiamine phosphate synthase [Oleiagrimonas soli]|uniref:Thiamine-phosphate synthase n=1 Tax=Oleiagrimonas soli TaxID=1543381 RepID=A0A099CSP9_9GAMM|nr:thiamine phosphate synthase [Oleiagrimonas soli]KGI76642.1 thiamine-phosphate synthase [Oleiagrimonas soli]MBB6185153.1 thiamine-phosphate pyrophosphorylase [Oleiagrimonas soli]
MSTKRLPHGGLYAIANGARADLVDRAVAAMQGGARMLQYRDLHSDERTRLATARALVAAAQPFGVPVLVDHDIALMHASGAAGVHLGSMDDDPAAVRAALGEHAVIGVSCYGDLERAREMARKDVDYLSFGAFHPSPSKPQARQVPIDLLREAATLGPAVVAIGGITPDNGAPLIAAGADFLASISGVFDADDTRAAAQRFSTLFDATRAASS